MYKIYLPIHKNSGILSHNSTNKAVFRVGFSNDKNDEIQYISPEIIEEYIEWIFENTTGRFTFYGSTIIYFEKEEDAVAFKLRWSI